MTMTVGQLIAELSQVKDLNTPVQIEDCELGLVPLTCVKFERHDRDIILSSED